MRKVVLASTSPQRKELLSQLGIEFEICDSCYKEDESLPVSPNELVETLSLCKAQAVSNRFPDTIIIAADTMVFLDEKPYAKPTNETHAKEMLKELSGKVHEVISGFTILDTVSSQSITKSIATKVFMRHVEESEIEKYIATGEPMNKAGAYGIQGKGAVFVEKIDGDYNNVVGLPLFALAAELKKLGVEILKYL